jgi:hypothetical protein
MKILGVILIVAGILMMVFRGFYFTKKETVLDIGPVEINKKERQAVDWPIYAGGIITAAGVIILVAAKRRN